MTTARCMRHVLFSVLLLLWASRAHAVAVAVVRPPNPTPALTEILTRLHGELLSVGIDVKTVKRRTNRGLTERDARACLGDIQGADGLDAVIEIVGDTEPVAVDVCVLEGTPRHAEISRIVAELNAENSAERLAIRAVELLRSIFLAQAMAARPRPREVAAAPPTATQRPTATLAPNTRSERFGVELGAVALFGVGGIGPGISPILIGDWAVHPRLVIQAAVAGLGSRPTVTTAAGNARIGQEYAVLGGSYRFLPDAPLQAFASLSAGALRLSVDGHADLPRHGHSEHQWSVMLDASLGLLLRLSERYFLALAGHVQMAETYAAIYFEDAAVATTGRPNLALSLTLGAWL